MTIKALKNTYIKTLSSLYSEEELGSIFYILTEKFLGRTRLQVALDPHEEINAEEVLLMEQVLKRLQQHEPVQYITGENSFFGLSFQVDPSVLIPRPETEELVSWILEDLKKSNIKEPAILDIGTGSGCIAISLAKHLQRAKVTAIDISATALQTAKNNARLNEVHVEFHQKDILKEIIQGKYDVIVSNPPYVRQLERVSMHPNVLEHEPASALYVSDKDPLLFYERIADIAKEPLGEGGSLYFELNQYLAEETEALLRRKDFQTRLKKDIFGVYRMVKASIS